MSIKVSVCSESAYPAGSQRHTEITNAIRQHLRQKMLSSVTFSKVATTYVQGWERETAAVLWYSPIHHGGTLDVFLLFGEYRLYFVYKISAYSASSAFLWPHSPICFLSCAVKHFCSNATHSGLNLLGPSEHEIQTKSSAPGS